MMSFVTGKLYTNGKTMEAKIKVVQDCVLDSNLIRNISLTVVTMILCTFALITTCNIPTCLLLTETDNDENDGKLLVLMDSCARLRFLPDTGRLTSVENDHEG